MSKPVTAAAVRDYFRADEARMSRLSPEAQATVATGARGRLHKEAVKVFNTKRSKDRRYVLGATKKVTAARDAERKALIDAGIAVGKRGPLSKDAKAFLAQSK